MSDNRIQIDDQLFCHFVTFSCDKRRRLLDEDTPKRILLSQLCSQLSHQSAKCVGFVVMPDHVHTLLWFPATNQLTRFMQSWKRVSSYLINRWYQQHSANYYDKIKQTGRFWTPKFHSFEIYTNHKIEEKLNYMHQNPVKAKLVTKSIDWKWSSARWYEKRQSVGVPISSLEL